MTTFSFLLFTVVQLVSTAWCIRWYAIKHPAEAKEMWASARKFLFL